LIAILLYVYHTEIWDDLYPLLLNIKDSSNLFISLYEDHDNTKIIKQAKELNTVKISFIKQNHGVDISPFLYQINDIDKDNFSYFIKLHSKKSLLQNRIQWRSILYHSLVGSKDILEQNTQILNKNKLVGAITDKSMIMNSIGHNKKHLNYLCKLLKINNKKKNFMAGSMFMARTSIFQKYLNDSTIPIIDNLLEDGAVKDIDRGTFCHAMERVFGKIVLENHAIKPACISPSFKVYNTEYKESYSFYITYDNYCYSWNLPRFFGKILEFTDNLLCIEWKHLSDNGSIIKKYHKNTNQYYIRIS
jgi:lipopolysaccharide biosynthesis protein